MLFSMRSRDTDDLKSDRRAAELQLDPDRCGLRFLQTMNALLAD